MEPVPGRSIGAERRRYNPPGRLGMEPVEGTDMEAADRAAVFRLSVFSLAWAWKVLYCDCAPNKRDSQLAAGNL
jgi:hypothetical protein